jgi:hypothetical protein
MTVQHQGLAAGRWFELSLAEQMANIGSEVGRALSWREKNNQAYSQLAFERSLELIDLTLSDKRHIKRFKEIARVREALADHFVFGNSYHSTPASWQEYFLPFNFAARARLDRAS